MSSNTAFDRDSKDFKSDPLSNFTVIDRLPQRPKEAICLLAIIQAYKHKKAASNPRRLVSNSYIGELVAGVGFEPTTFRL